MSLRISFSFLRDSLPLGTLLWIECLIFKAAWIRNMRQVSVVDSQSHDQILNSLKLFLKKNKHFKVRSNFSRSFSMNWLFLKSNFWWWKMLQIACTDPWWWKRTRTSTLPTSWTRWTRTSWASFITKWTVRPHHPLQLIPMKCLKSQNWRTWN